MKARVCLLAYLVCSVFIIVQAQRGSHRYAQSGDRTTGDDDISSREGHIDNNARHRSAKETPRTFPSRDSPLSAPQRSNRVTPEAFERSFNTDQNTRRFPSRPALQPQSIQLEQAFNTDKYSTRFTPRPTPQSTDRSFKNVQPDKVLRNSRVSSGSRETSDSSKQIDDLLTQRDPRFKSRNSDLTTKSNLQKKQTQTSEIHSDTSSPNQRREFTSRNSKTVKDENAKINSAQTGGRRSRIHDDNPQSDRRSNVQLPQKSSREEVNDRQNRRNFQLPSRNSGISQNNGNLNDAENIKNLKITDNESTQRSRGTISRLAGANTRSSTQINENKESIKLTDSKTGDARSSFSNNQRLNSRFLNREKEQERSNVLSQSDIPERSPRTKDRRLNNVENLRESTLNSDDSTVKLNSRNKNDESIHEQTSNTAQALTRRNSRVNPTNNNRHDEILSSQLKQVEGPTFIENKERINTEKEQSVIVEKIETNSKEILDQTDVINSAQLLSHRRNLVKNDNIDNKPSTIDVVQLTEGNNNHEKSNDVQTPIELSRNENKVLPTKESEDISVQPPIIQKLPNNNEDRNTAVQFKPIPLKSSRNFNARERENDQNPATSQVQSSRRLKSDKYNPEEAHITDSRTSSSNSKHSRYRNRVNEETRSAGITPEGNVDEKKISLSRGSSSLPTKKENDRENLKNGKIREFTAKSGDFKRRSKDTTPTSNPDNILRDLNEPQAPTNFRKNLRDRDHKKIFNDENSEDKLLATAETITGRRTNFRENFPIAESDSSREKVNEAQLLSSRARLKEIRSHENSAEKVLSTGGTINGRLNSKQNLKQEIEINKSQEEIQIDGLKETSKEKGEELNRKLNIRQNLLNSRKPQIDSVVTENSSDKENARKSQRGTSRGSNSYKKNVEDEGSSGRPAKKNDKSGKDGKNDDAGIDDDDNYPVEYKQLVKAGNGPKEILEMLKARKAQREAAQKAAESLHGQHSVRASLLAVRPQLIQEMRSQISEEAITKPTPSFESKTDKYKSRNENLRESSKSSLNSENFSNPNQRESVNENEPAKKVGSSRTRTSNRNTKNDAYSKFDSDIKEEDNTKFFQQQKYADEKEPTNRNENVKTTGPGRSRTSNRNTKKESAEKFDSDFKQVDENIDITTSTEQKYQDVTDKDTEFEVKPRRTYTRRDEQNKPIKEFKIKPTVEVETERPRFLPSSKRTSSTLKDDSVEVDSENDEVRVLSKLKYQLYESNARKKFGNNQFKAESTTIPNKEYTSTVTRSYSKLARFPKIPTVPIQPGTTTEGSLAARLNARRLRQQQQSTTTAAADVPETLPPVTIIYANSLPTAKPLESDSLILELTTQADSTPTSATSPTSTTVISGITRSSTTASIAWNTEVAQQDSTTVKTTAETPTSTAFSTIASAMSHTSVKTNDIFIVTPVTSSEASIITDKPNPSTTIKTPSSTPVVKQTTITRPLVNLINRISNSFTRQTTTSTQKPVSTTIKQSFKPKHKNNKTVTQKPQLTKSSPKPSLSNELIKASETKQFENNNLTALNSLTTPRTQQPYTSVSPNPTNATPSPPSSTTSTTISSPSSTTTTTPSPKSSTIFPSSTVKSNPSPITSPQTTRMTTVSLPSSSTTTTSRPLPSPSPKTVFNSTPKTQASPSMNTISTTTKKPFPQTTRKPMISTTYIPQTTTTKQPITTTTAKPSSTTTTKKPQPKPKPKPKIPATTKSPLTTTKKPNSKRQSDNSKTTKPTATPIPVFINSTTNKPSVTTATTLTNKPTTTTGKPLTISPSTKKPEQNNLPFKISAQIKSKNDLTEAEDRIDEIPEVQETSADFVVYGLLPNKSLVRRVPTPTPRTELPFVVYGLYPNGTIVRRFPNGTIIPDDPQETNELVAETVDPTDKTAISELLQRDQPPTRNPPTTTAFTPQTTTVFTTLSPTTSVTTESTTITQTTQTTPSTTTVTTTTRAPSTTTTTTQRTTTTKRPVTTTKKATVTTKKATAATTKKPQPTTTTTTTTTTKKPQPVTTTTKKPTTAASKPKSNKPAKKPKQSPSTTKKPVSTTTTPRPTTPAGVIQSATRVAEDFALLNSLLMRKPPDENINANSIAPVMMSSTPSTETDDLANRIIQLAIERAGPGSSPPTPASALVTLAGTQASNLQDLSLNSNSFSPSASTSLSSASPDSSMASSKPGGKISVWVVPEGDTNSVSDGKTTPTVPKLTPQEEQVLNALLSSPTPTRDQLLLAGSRGGGLLRSLGSNTNEGEGDDSNEGNAQTPRRPLISAAINMSRAVSQFMGLVIQDAVQQLRAYLDERLNDIMGKNSTITTVS